VLITTYLKEDTLMAKSIYSFLDLWGLINHVGAPATTYVDLEQMSVVVFDQEINESEKLLRIPYEEELYSYGKVMNEYLTINSIDIPKGQKAGRYLKERGRYFDFCDFRDDRILDALTDWLKVHEIELVKVA